MARRLTKRQKRMLRQDGLMDEHNEVTKGKFNLIDLNFDLTNTQEQVIDAYESGSHLVLHGMAGTGKTFISFPERKSIAVSRT